MITETTRRLLGIPEHFVDDIGGITLTSWWPVISEAIRSLPGGVVEIGADKGFTTRMVSELCHELAVPFVSVDPSPSDGVDDIVGVDHRRITSSEFFKSGQVPAATVWIVDGDHNYETVAMELEGIAKATASSDCLIFLHDLGWPNGRRDFWYSLDSAPDDASRMSDGHGVSLDVEGVCLKSQGIGLGSIAAVAPLEGGPRNGVLTAVEDFLATDEGSAWEFRWTPVFFGFGYLVKRVTLAGGRLSLLEERFKSFDNLRDILGPLEFNRLRLLQTTNIKWSESAGKDSRIAELERRVSDLEGSTNAVVELGVWSRIKAALKILNGQ